MRQKRKNQFPSELEQVIPNNIRSGGGGVHKEKKFNFIAFLSYNFFQPKRRKKSGPMDLEQTIPNIFWSGGLVCNYIWNLLSFLAKFFRQPWPNWSKKHQKNSGPSGIGKLFQIASDLNYNWRNEEKETINFLGNRSKSEADQLGQG